MPKVHDAIKRKAWDPRQMKEHKKLVQIGGYSSSINIDNIGKSYLMYVKEWKKCYKIIKNVRFDIVMDLIPHIQLQISIFHAILVQMTRSKPIIFLIVAMNEANKKSNKKGKKMASSCKNHVICPGLVAHMHLILVFRVMQVAYRPWKSPWSTNLEKMFSSQEIWKFSSP